MSDLSVDEGRDDDSQDLVAYATQNPGPVGEPAGTFEYPKPAPGLVIADLERRLQEANARVTAVGDEFAKYRVSVEKDRLVFRDLMERRLAEERARSKAYFDLLVAFETAREERNK